MEQTPPSQTLTRREQYSKNTFQDFNTVFQKSLDPLSPGTVISIELKATNCVRFVIDLQCEDAGDVALTNIAMRMHILFDRHIIFRNAYTRCRWGVPESGTISKFMISRDRKFLIEIGATESHFVIMIDQKHFCNFRFRIPLVKIKELLIGGNVEVISANVAIQEVIGLDENTIPTVSWGVKYRPDNRRPIGVPFTGWNQNLLKRGNKLCIYGRTKVHPHSLTICIQDGSQIWPVPNIVINIYCQFSTGTGVNRMSFSSCYDGVWKPEEKASNFNMVPGFDFTFIIKMEFSRFSIWTDGLMVGEYNYKQPLAKFSTSHVYIQGDIEIHHITIRHLHESDASTHTRRISLYI